MHFTSSREHAILFFVSRKTLSINMFYYKSVLCLMHDISNKRVPSNILDLFTETNEIHSHLTRSAVAGNFYVKYSRLNIQNESFSRLEEKIWNGIPERLCSTNRSVFKKKIHELLLKVLDDEDIYIDMATQIKKLPKYFV